MVCVICPPHLSSSPPHIIVSQFLSSGAVGLFPITEAQSSSRIMAPSCSEQRAAPRCHLNSRTVLAPGGPAGLEKAIFFSEPLSEREEKGAEIHPRLESSVWEFRNRRKKKSDPASSPRLRSEARHTPTSERSAHTVPRSRPHFKKKKTYILPTCSSVLIKLQR